MATSHVCERESAHARINRLHAFRRIAVGFIDALLCAAAAADDPDHNPPTLKSGASPVILARAISAYSSLSSRPIKRMRSAEQATPVDPLPANMSSTTPS